MQNYNAGEVKLTFSALFFCLKLDYFCMFFTPAKNYKKAVSIRFEHQITFLCSSKDRAKVLSLVELYPKKPDIAPFF